MAKLLENICDLNDLILQGKILEAFETYYHENVVIQENKTPPTIGKSANRKHKEAFIASVTEFCLAKPLKVTIGEGVSMVEWYFEYTYKDFGKRKYSQVSVQEWKDELIISEKIYHNS